MGRAEHCSPRVRTVPYCTVLYKNFIVVLFTVLYCTILYCTVLCCIVLYYIYYILPSSAHPGSELFTVHTHLYCIQVRTRGGIYGQIYPSASGRQSPLTSSTYELSAVQQIWHNIKILSFPEPSLLPLSAIYASIYLTLTDCALFPAKRC